MENAITIEATVNAAIETVWKCWTNPEHITKWAFASDEWAAPFAENDIRTGGRFNTRMEAKDKSAGFDFNGVYTNIKEHELIEYDMADGRHVTIQFSQTSEGTHIIQSFEPEDENTHEMQRIGWQSILNNFKKYVEGIE